MNIEPCNGEWKLSVYESDDQIHQPTWQQIQTQFDLLQGNKKSQVVLELKDVGSLLVSGGGKAESFFHLKHPLEKWQEDERMDQSVPIYCATFFEPRKDWYQLAQVECKFTLEEFTYLDQKQTQEVQVCYCVSREEVIQAIQFFYQTGQMDPALTWIHEG